MINDSSVGMLLIMAEWESAVGRRYYLFNGVFIVPVVLKKIMTVTSDKVKMGHVARWTDDIGMQWR